MTNGSVFWLFSAAKLCDTVKNILDYRFGFPPHLSNDSAITDNFATVFNFAFVCLHSVSA